jgi:hypothetical protein
MKRIAIQLWHDQRGTVSAVSTLLLYTVLGLGAVAGLATLRNQLVQECGDLAGALDHLDQSWTVTLPDTTVLGYTDPGTTLDDVAGDPPAGISVTELASPEGTPLP